MRRNKGLVLLALVALAAFMITATVGGSASASGGHAVAAKKKCKKKKASSAKKKKCKKKKGGRRWSGDADVVRGPTTRTRLTVRSGGANGGLFESGRQWISSNVRCPRAQRPATELNDLGEHAVFRSSGPTGW